MTVIELNLSTYLDRAIKVAVEVFEAVPVLEAGLAQLGGGAGGGGFEYVEEAGDRAGVGVAATEDGAARGGADGAVGVGAGKAGAL